MNECYCCTHRYKRQGSHAHPSLTTLVPVKRAARRGECGVIRREDRTDPAMRFCLRSIYQIRSPAAVEVASGAMAVPACPYTRR